MNTINATLVFILVYCSLCRVAAGRDFEAELISYLKNNITNYSPLIFPRLDHNSTVQIAMTSMIGRLISVDSAKQSVRIASFMMATWEEERLVWNATNFGGVTTINWESSQVWFPVIIIYNGVGSSQVLSADMPVYLVSGGPSRTLVTASWRRELEFSCQFEMSKFPSDEHVCDIEFFFSDQGRGNKMVRPIKQAGMSFDELAIYQPNSEWTLINATSFVEDRHYTFIKGHPQMSLPTYILRIHIKRVSNYYIMNIVTPLLLLALLQVLLYLVPVESGEKLGFGITIMLSYTVFLLLLDGILPKTQSTPAIASFITAAMILSTISLLLTSLIMRFHFTPEGTRMPACTRAFFIRFLGRLFCVSGSARVDQGTTNASESSVRKADGDAPVKSSDWVIAAHAIERFMVGFGVISTACIVVIFIVIPYVI